MTLKTKNKFTIFAGIIANKYAMIERNLYMKQIRPFMNRPFIKVIAGIRRCGLDIRSAVIYGDDDGNCWFHGISSDCARIYFTASSSMASFPWRMASGSG